MASPARGLRRARRKDIPDLCRLMTLYSKWSGGKSRMTAKDFEHYCLSPKKMATAWIATANSKPVGFALTGEWVSFGGPFKVRHVYHLFVEDKFRKSGIATALLQYIIKEAFSKGCLRVDINADKDNPVANQLYKKLGFKDKKHLNNTYQLANY